MYISQLPRKMLHTLLMRVAQASHKRNFTTTTVLLIMLERINNRNYAFGLKYEGSAGHGTGIFSKYLTSFLKGSRAPLRSAPVRTTNPQQQPAPPNRGSPRYLQVSRPKGAASSVEYPQDNHLNTPPPHPLHGAPFQSKSRTKLVII